MIGDGDGDDCEDHDDRDDEKEDDIFFLSWAAIRQWKVFGDVR